MFNTKKHDWYFIFSAVLVWLLALGLTAWDFFQLRQARYSPNMANLLGVVLILSGVIIRLRARRALGKYFSSGLRMIEKHELVTGDIYAHVRHPAYTGALLVWSGVPLLVSSWYGFLVMLLLIPCFMYRITIEEKMLLETFGNEYEDYIKRSKKLVPYVY